MKPKTPADKHGLDFSRTPRDPRLQGGARGLARTKTDGALTQAKRVLRAALERAGWRVVEILDRDWADFEVGRPGGPIFLLALKLVASPRLPQLRAFLAQGLLDVRTAVGGGQPEAPRPAAAPRHWRQAQPVAVVATTHLSRSMERELDAYARRFGEGFGWMDLNGRLVIKAKGLQVDVGETTGADPFRLRLEIPIASEARPAPRLDITGRAQLSSDLSRWLIKCLLTRDLGPDLLGVQPHRADSASALGEVACVSIPTAARFVKALRESGDLGLRNGELRFARDRVWPLLELMKAPVTAPVVALQWRDTAARDDAVIARALKLYDRRRREWEESIPMGESRAFAHKARQACVGLEAAAATYGLGGAPDAPVSIYVPSIFHARPIREALEAAGGPMDVVEDATADVVLRVPRFPRSTLRGVVVRDGLPVTDLVQLWWDLSLRSHEGTSPLADAVKARLVAQLGVKPI